MGDLLEDDRTCTRCACRSLATTDPARLIIDVDRPRVVSLSLSLLTVRERDRVGAGVDARCDVRPGPFDGCLPRDLDRGTDGLLSFPSFAAARVFTSIMLETVMAIIS